ncbi:probable E3 ubiquitin-protein ligase RHY1A [Solenopsis invicta]|uniref:probable E3 ubiquitin-protein ligase RHY1A n=1 Tax=Solenopsis invicta TaxID=13686 RepID=UPI00193E4B7F|nr:probable E3 ubiquitin-protein ligase RHY1A [Solenopsis invicta]
MCHLNVIKMTYPGLVLLVGVGVGIATFLYYVFTENNRTDEQYSSYSRSNRRSSEDCYEDRSWSTSSHPTENALLNRRSSSNSSKSKERRDFVTSKDDINNCSICQYAIVDSDVIQLHPCRHNFHKDCINELIRKYGALCPNCRRKFEPRYK